MWRLIKSLGLGIGLIRSWDLEVWDLLGIVSVQGFGFMD